jgi:enoyl-CoA hydratase/carnithine racemase
MSTRLVGYTLDGPLAWITLNRPAKLNAINGEMLRGIDAALDRAEAD